MKTILPVIVCAVFGILALWHFIMALNLSGASRRAMPSAAVPSVNGVPVFAPSAMATIGVGVVLLLFAALVAAMAGILSTGIPRVTLAWLSYGLALGLLARAVGEFKYVGFFKRVRGSAFATMDTFIYSPLCLVLSASVAWIAAQSGAS